MPLDDREFIAWDGEGINIQGPNFPQSYILFGNSLTGHIQSESHIHTFDLLDFIITTGKRAPTAFHVGFSFNYDANMLMRSLSRDTLERLHKNGHISLRRKDVGDSYYIEFLPGKWLSITHREVGYDAKTNRYAKSTVKIYDIFSFFGTSFVKAYSDLVGKAAKVVEDGKAARGTWTLDDLRSGEVLRYWQAEIQELRELAEELRRRLYGAGLRISQWHGPGALASYTLKKNGIKAHMAICPEPVRRAAAYGYAGGRFEMFKLGRIQGPIYSMDINSAYPYGIAQLPSLSVGGWNHVTAPKRIAKFGVYRVRLLPRLGGTFLERAPGPLFHRDKMGNISFPWVTEGWYWSPEVRNLSRLPKNTYEIVEGWEYLGYAEAAKPFAFVPEAYELRREWKRDGNASQLALKLMLNSLYGKMAQRIGWDENKRTAPNWHQLEWAGWVTSNCRAMLWEAMSRIPRSDLVAVETDGLYTTRDPATLGIHGSTELGGWEVDVYDELIYVQSGLAWLRSGECKAGCDHSDEARKQKVCAWICKRRGLDARTFGLVDCRDYIRSLAPGGDWDAYEGRTTRFVGFGAALASNAPFKVRHCVWHTVPRYISPGKGGKRVHIHRQCAACSAGLSAYDGGHDMSIRSLAYQQPLSNPHDIPWEDKEDPGYMWRNVEPIGELVND